MVKVHSNGSGQFYLRHGDKILSKLGYGQPTIYKPQLLQEKAENVQPLVSIHHPAEILEIHSQARCSNV